MFSLINTMFTFRLACNMRQFIRVETGIIAGQRDQEGAKRAMPPPPPPRSKVNNWLLCAVISISSYFSLDPHYN